MSQNTSLDVKIASLTDIGEMRSELQLALATLRQTGTSTEVMDQLSHAALILMRLVFRGAGRKQPDEDLAACSSAANKTGLLPQQIFFLLGIIIDWSKKAKESETRERVAGSRAETQLAILLEAVVWFCCEYKHGLNLSSIYREEKVHAEQRSALAMKISSLSDRCELRDELQNLSLTLADNPIGVMNGLSRTALLLMSLVFQQEGQKRPSDNLGDCCEKALSLNLIPYHVYLALGSIRVWSNKADHAVEQVKMTTIRAEIHLTLMLETVSWYYCENKHEPGLSSIYREEEAGPYNVALSTAEGIFAGHWPVFFGECVGREECLAEVHQGLINARVLVLTGGPGYGKTRVAWEYAEGNKAAYPNGLFFANLTTLPARANSDSLKLYLRQLLGPFHGSGEAALLVLDNCEHLASVVGQKIRDLQTEQPHLHILATSRTSLDPFPSCAVTSLPIPEEEEVDDLKVLDWEDIERYAAVDLFVRRARLVVPGFEIDEDNAQQIVAICRKVGGIPFALELVARSVRLRLKDILGSLDDSLVAESEGGDLAATDVRHGTVNSCVRWSINLLPKEVQQVLYHASIFRGGFSADAYQDVILGRAEHSLPALSWNHAILELSGHGLITQGVNNLYELPGPVRLFALKQLKADAQYSDYRAAYEKWLEAQSELPTLLSVGQQDPDKIHQAIANADDAIKIADTEKDQGIAALVRSQRAAYLMISGKLFQSSQLLRQALPYMTGARECEALLGIGMVMYLKCDFEAALEHTRQSAKIAEKVGSTGIEALALSSQGVLEGFVFGPKPETDDRLSDAIKLSKEDGDLWTIGYAYLSKGTYLWHADRLEEAEVAYLTALEKFRTIKDKLLTVFALNSLGHLARVAGRFGQAATYYLASMKLCQGYLFERGRCGCVLGTSGMALGLNREEDAVLFWGAAIRQYDRLGVKMIPPIKRCYLEKFDALRLSLEAREPGKYMRLYQQGQRLTLPQAFKRAQEFLVQVQKSESQSSAALFMPSSKI